MDIDRNLSILSDDRDLWTEIDINCVFVWKSIYIKFCIKIEGLNGSYSANTQPLTQEIYSPGTAISDASNLYTAVGGDKNKEFRGKTSNMWEGG